MTAPATTVEKAPTASRWRAFLAVLHRDVYVTGRELPLFLAQVVAQPLFLLFVFGKVLGNLGYTTPGYADLLFPGLLALTAVITGMQTLAFPLVAEFGWTKEIEDRLLAPMPTGLVAAEKLVFAALRALVASCSPASANIRGPPCPASAGSRSCVGAQHHASVVMTPPATTRRRRSFSVSAM